MDCVAILIFLVCFFHISQGKYLAGRLVSPSNWEFLTRFCFLSEEGEFKFHFEYPYEFGTQNVLLYFDEPSQWDAVYKTETNCFQKEAVLRPENNQVITLSTAYSWSGCKLVNSSTTGWRMMYQCRGGRKFKSARERWWFFAVSHCGFDKGLNLTYQLWMTNGQDFLHKEYSADEFYIFPNHMIFLLASLLMVAASLAVAVTLKSRQLFHTTYKLYMVSLVCETISLFQLSFASGRYGHTGITQESTEMAGRVIGSVGEVAFLLMVILLAKGFTITVGRLPGHSWLKLIIFFVLYIFTLIVLLVWSATNFDPGLVLYIYESPPGYGLVALRTIGWLWFCYSIFFTLKNHSERRLFYYPFLVFYTLWFLIGPVVILVSQHAIPLWAREKTVAAVENLLTFAGHIFFLVLTRPHAANKNFPFHVKTTQIAAMTDVPIPMDTRQSRTSRPAELSTFTHSFSTENNYRGPDFTDLFTVSSEKEKQSGVDGGTGDMKRDAFVDAPPGRLAPLENAPRPPMLVAVTPRDPPSYDSLFRAT